MHSSLKLFIKEEKIECENFQRQNSHSERYVKNSGCRLRTRMNLKNGVDVHGLNSSFGCLSKITLGLTT